MVQYIYFVKCPECEDEHFDYFDEAKEFAMSCLTKKPIITQIEVERNDFGECTDSCDLGTVWSWEDLMDDVSAEPEATVFSKSETFGASEVLDEFDDFDACLRSDEFDDSAAFDPETYEITAENDLDEGCSRKALFEADDYVNPEYERRHAQTQSGYDVNKAPSASSASASARDNDLENRASRTQLGYNAQKAPSKADASARDNDIENRDAIAPDQKTISKILVKYATLMPYDMYDKLEGSAAQVLKASNSWWLKSPGDEAGYACCVTADGKLKDQSVASKQGLRPVIEIIPADFADDKLYQPVKSLNGDWIKISDKYLLFKNPTDMVAFDTINTMQNDFEKAAIKKTLDAWCERYFKSVGAVFGSNSAEYTKEVSKELSKRESIHSRPIPKNMTIESLVEEMEENEDEVECKWCNELFDKSECRYEVDLGYLCDRCQAAIKSRGETLTFREGPELYEAASLTEANQFRYLDYIADVEDLIIQELTQNGFGRYLDNTNSGHIFNPLPLQDAAGFKYGDILDFDVEANGNVNIITSNRTMTLAFAGQLVRGNKPNRARALIKAIQDAVDVIDKAHRPTRTQRAAERAADRLATVLNMLNADPTAVAELKAHITNITFKVPLQDNYEYILDEADPDYEAAVNKLEKLKDNFTQLPFAQDAIDKGVAVDRDDLPVPGKYWHIVQRWYLTGIITFDCSIGDLINSKYIIEAARVENMANDGRIADLNKTNSTSCYNLAVALIMHHNNDVLFFKNKTNTVLGTPAAVNNNAAMTDDSIITEAYALALEEDIQDLNSAESVEAITEILDFMGNEDFKKAAGTITDTLKTMPLDDETLQELTNIAEGVSDSLSLMSDGAEIKNFGDFLEAVDYTEIIVQNPKAAKAIAVAALTAASKADPTGITAILTTIVKMMPAKMIANGAKTTVMGKLIKGLKKMNQVVTKEDYDPVHDLGNEYDGGYPVKKPLLQEFDDEIPDHQLALCPECGENGFDHETGICNNCGFNID